MRNIVVLGEFLCRVQDMVKPDQEGVSQWVNTQKRFFLEPPVGWADNSHEYRDNYVVSMLLFLLQILEDKQYSSVLKTLVYISSKHFLKWMYTCTQIYKQIPLKLYFSFILDVFWG